MTQDSDKKGFGVMASPFNGVKLELGIILCLGVLLWLAADSITANLDAQLLLLAAFGLLGMVWLIVRTRQVLNQCRDSGAQENKGQDGA